jgi:ABC-type transporter Mla MlaB component
MTDQPAGRTNPLLSRLSSFAPTPDSGQGRSDMGWRSDVVLEMWIDVERTPVLVRLAGTLSRATADRLVSVVSELVGNGHHDFDLQARELEVSDTAGAEALMDLQRLITRSGGRVGWDTPTIANG